MWRLQEWTFIFEECVPLTMRPPDQELTAYTSINLVHLTLTLHSPLPRSQPQAQMETRDVWAKRLYLRLGAAARSIRRDVHVGVAAGFCIDLFAKHK
jgi:hypothetical protein